MGDTAFAFLTAGEIHFGRGVAGEAVARALGFGARVLVVHGANVTRAEWLLDGLREALVPANRIPSITAHGGAAEASVTVAEGTTDVATIAAADPDAGDTGLWTAADWANGGVFLNDWAPERVSAGADGLTLTLGPDGAGGFESGEYRTNETFGEGRFGIQMRASGTSKVTSYTRG